MPMSPRVAGALLSLSLVLTSCATGDAPASSPPVVGPAAAIGSEPPVEALPLEGQPLPSSDLPAAETAMIFDQLAIWDPDAGDIPAVTFLAPVGWAAEGNVIWTHEWSRLAQLQTRVSDPQSGITIEWLPLQDFVWVESRGFDAPIGGNYMGKAYVPPITDPAQFVAEFWMPGPLAHLRQATLVDVQQVPAVAAEFLRLFGAPADVAAYKLRYEYTWDGRPWEEEVSFALLFAPGQGVTFWYVQFATAVRAPLGGIAANQGVISTVLASRTTTPEWEAVYRTVQSLFQQGLQQQIEDTRAFGEALAQYRAETHALQQEVTAERQASQDRIAELRQEVLGGVDTYVDPVNQTLVQLPVGWQNYWVNERGQYVAADAGFDPNTVLGPGWQQLTPRP
jgi:hypothetical protein